MKKGKIPYNSLVRSILRPVWPQRELLQVAGDGAHIDEQTGVSVNTTIYGGENSVAIGLARAYNSALAAGILPQGVFLCATLPEKEKESKTAARQQELVNLASKKNLMVFGGHTTYSPQVTAPVLAFTITGRNVKEQATPKAGQSILMIGTAGACGAAIAYQEMTDMLKEHFSGEFLQGVCENFPENLFVSEKLLSCRFMKDSFLHDISEGGILGTLWELAECGQCGLSIDQKQIPVRQETVEICEMLHWNPYTLLSIGGMILCVTDEDLAMEELEELGISASLIGTIQPGKDKLLTRDDEIRYLDRPASDDIMKLENFG